MKQDCMIIRGKTPNGDGTEYDFRPSSSWPDNHWTTQLLDAYGIKENFQIKWLDDELVITITRKSHEEDETLFNHIMDFCRMWKLDYTICNDQCAKCQGHPNCLSED